MDDKLISVSTAAERKNVTRVTIRKYLPQLHTLAIENRVYIVDDEVFQKLEIKGSVTAAKSNISEQLKGVLDRLATLEQKVAVLESATRSIPGQASGLCTMKLEEPKTIPEPSHAKSDNVAHQERELEITTENHVQTVLPQSVISTTETMSIRNQAVLALHNADSQQYSSNKMALLNIKDASSLPQSKELSAWLQVRPNVATDESLFCGFPANNGGRRMTSKAIRNILAKVQKESGHPAE